MRRLLLSFFCSVMIAAPALAVEDLTLTTPETRTSVTKWRLDRLTIDRSAAHVVMVFIEPTTSETRTCEENGAAALSLISTLNTANLTSNSLQKRAITRAQSTGCLAAGTIAGTPE